MNSRATVGFMVVVLTLIGLSLAFLRHLQTGIPFVPGERTSIWLVEARVDFVALGGAVTASLSIPDQIPGFQISGEQAASAGYGFSIIDREEERRGEWTRREASGAQSLYFSANFIPGPKSIPHTGEEPTARPVFWGDAEVTAARALNAAAASRSSDPRSLARELALLLSESAPSQNAALLLARADDANQLLGKLLNDADIPTREVMGLPLEDARRRQSLQSLLELYDGEQWVLVDPSTGPIEAPEDLLLWHRGGRSVLDVSGGRSSRLSFSMIRQSVPAVQLAVERDENSLFSLIGVHRLPIEEQSMFKLLLLLPLGASVVVFCRVLIGVQTAGTFMPVLIALVFLQTALLPGLLAFVSVVIVGLLMRGYLSQLNLLLVARIAALIVLVIFLISLLSIIGYQLGISTGMVITFFPMIIIAWTIERLSILWEEEGPRDVLVQGGGSLLVAVLSFLLMQSSLMQHLSFNFPELNLLLLAAILAMGQYTGYKLLELRRFAVLGD
ncbi:MAG: inactive transglutaminase family protein [Pseudomonadota bacterium]